MDQCRTLACSAEPDYSADIAAAWAVKAPLRGRFVGSDEERRKITSLAFQPKYDPTIQSPEPNIALSGRPQPFPASSETSIGERFKLALLSHFSAF